jgi:membrane protease YdiL (CAAX protease family)
MKFGTWAATALVALALFFFFFPANAYAYLDPGTGSYLLQIALAALVGALFAIRLFWSRIKSFFKKLFSRQEPEGPDED